MFEADPVEEEPLPALNDHLIGDAGVVDDEEDDAMELGLEESE